MGKRSPDRYGQRSRNRPAGDRLCTGERLDELARFLLSLELQEALRQLSAEQRKILTLLFLDDLKPTEVAGRLGCTVRNVTKHRLKALDKMRQLLAH